MSCVEFRKFLHNLSLEIILYFDNLGQVIYLMFQQTSSEDMILSNARNLEVRAKSSFVRNKIYEENRQKKKNKLSKDRGFDGLYSYSIISPKLSKWLHLKLIDYEEDFFPYFRLCC